MKKVSLVSSLLILLVSNSAFATAMEYMGVCKGLVDGQEQTLKVFSDYDGCKKVSNIALLLASSSPSPTGEPELFTGTSTASAGGELYTVNHDFGTGKELKLAELLISEKTAEFSIISDGDPEQPETMKYTTSTLTCSMMHYHYDTCNP